MKIQLFKKDFRKATSDIKGKFYLPWDWEEMRRLDIMWPDSTPIEIEIDSVDLTVGKRRHETEQI